MSDRVLIQIEEPAERSDEVEDVGLAIGLELTPTGLLVAASVGGNVELIGGAGSIEFIPALAGYDAAGQLVLGHEGLADETDIGIEALADPEAPDARGLSLSDRLAALFETARHKLTILVRRPIAGAVVLVPLDAPAAARVMLMQAVEAGGIEVRRLIESSVGLALGGGLDRAGAGSYLHLAALPNGLALARLEVGDGIVRLAGGSAVRDPADLPALLVAEAPVMGLIAPGLADAGALAARTGMRLLDGFDGPERAVVGAALLAEALG
ncbi:MAG TPA: hypothetical protein VM689_23120 [Aliidongia sp.]|nr:hypothetical protein [Aliidongia sp.]